jgi:hypothetical protein
MATPKKKSVLEVARDWASFAMSTIAFLVSMIVAVFASIKQDEKVSVVFQAPPMFWLDAKASNIEARNPFSVVFINSGSRPAAVLQINVYLWETKVRKPDEEIGSWHCDQDAWTEGKPKRRLLKVDFEPFILKEKEILTRDLRFTAEAPSSSGVKVTGDKVTLPMPDWYKPGDEYWAHPCIEFGLATASDAYAASSIELGVTGYPKDGSGNYLGGGTISTAPYEIWHHRGTIFD